MNREAATWIDGLDPEKALAIVAALRAARADERAKMIAEQGMLTETGPQIEALNFHYQKGRERGAADERAKCIAAVSALYDNLAPGFLSEGVARALSALRSLSPLGLPTTEREQK